MISDISYKTLINPKPLRIRFFKIDGIIKTWIELGTRCDGTRYLTLFGSEKYEVIDNRIRYLKSQINGITYIFFLAILRKSK